MIFEALKLEGAFVIDLEKIKDQRGYFARAWCAKEFKSYGLETQFVQSSLSFNKVKGTLRGMHFQVSPAAETKLVRCIRGALYDVIVDIRQESRTFLQWIAVELTAENGKSLYIPEGFAHGFQSLEDCTEVYYQMTSFHTPACARGFHWKDPQIGIVWPEDTRTMSERDSKYPFFSQALMVPEVV